MAVTISHEGYRMSAIDICGRSITEVRKLYQAKLGIADRAVAILNNRDIGSRMEIQTVLNDHDKLVFAINNSLRPSLHRR